MEFKYNREKAELLRVMKAKAQKYNLNITETGNKILIGLETGKFKSGEDAVPVTFKGKIEENGSECSLKGKFSYGFNLNVLTVVAAILIIARFTWSAYKMQTDNMILCGIVTLLLAVVIVVIQIKSKPAKKIICEFLELQKR